jgi:hypothetical protein
MASSMAVKKTNVSTWLSVNFKLAVLRISSPESVEVDEKAKRRNSQKHRQHEPAFGRPYTFRIEWTGGFEHTVKESLTRANIRALAQISPEQIVNVLNRGRFRHAVPQLSLAI